MKNKTMMMTLFVLFSLGLMGAAPLSAEQPKGFVLAWVVFFFLAAALLYALARVGMAAFQDAAAVTVPAWHVWAVPALSLAGLVVAGYLTYVETQMVAAVCGPVGDCNAVQSSEYAMLFGVLPVALLGMLGYFGILGAWAWGCLRQDALSRLVPLGLFGMAFVGTVFSLYLTYLELFVIDAVCLWCISSAIIMGALLLISTPSLAAYLSAGEDED